MSATPRSCTGRVGCPAVEHMICCPRPPAAAVEVVAEHQVWERRLAGTDIAETRMFLTIDGQGRAHVHEAILVTLLRDAGWERTA